jgi:hypothetical protein
LWFSVVVGVTGAAAFLLLRVVLATTASVVVLACSISSSPLARASSISAWPLVLASSIIGPVRAAILSRLRQASTPATPITAAPIRNSGFFGTARSIGAREAACFTWSRRHGMR